MFSRYGRIEDLIIETPLDGWAAPDILDLILDGGTYLTATGGREHFG